MEGVCRWARPLRRWDGNVGTVCIERHVLRSLGAFEWSWQGGLDTSPLVGALLRHTLRRVDRLAGLEFGVGLATVPLEMQLERRERHDRAWRRQPWVVLVDLEKGDGD
jgi:hypothetical protein